MTAMIFAFLNIGTQEMILIVFVILMLFGGEKLPELARGLGKGIREFKDASEGIKREIADQINNFEKDLDVTTEPEAPKAIEPTKVAEVETPTNTTAEAAPKKKFEFTAPEGTIQHNPNRQLEYGEQPTYSTSQSTTAPASENVEVKENDSDAPAEPNQNA